MTWRIGVCGSRLCAWAEGLGFRVGGLGFGVLGLGMWSLGFGVWCLGIGNWCVEFGVRGWRFWVLPHSVSKGATPSKKAVACSQPYQSSKGSESKQRKTRKTGMTLSTAWAGKIRRSCLNKTNITNMSGSFSVDHCATGATSKKKKQKRRVSMTLSFAPTRLSITSSCLGFGVWCLGCLGVGV